MRGPVAKRYARAMLELALAHNAGPLFQRQLTELAEIYEGSAPFRAIIANPSVSVDERRKLVSEIAARAGFAPLVKNFALLLLDNARFDHVVAISASYNDQFDQHQGNVRALVTTAKPLKDAQVTAIKNAIAKLTGKTVLLQTAVDPELIGGAVTRIGSTMYDGSVRTQLQTIRNSILEEV